MSALTIELTEEVQHKIELMARARGVSSATLMEHVAADLARQYEAFKLYEEMAADGRGREAEALELLQRE